jgi:hypothetical protein
MSLVNDDPCNPHNLGLFLPGLGADRRINVSEPGAGGLRVTR